MKPEVRAVRRPRGKSAAIALALGAAAFLGVAVYAARHRILEAWHLHRLDAADPAARLEVIRMLGRVGSARSVPALGAILGSGKTEEVHAAIEALGNLGPAAVEAVPLLVPFLVAERELPGEPANPAPALAEGALDRIGPRCIPGLSASLQQAILPSKVAAMIVRFEEGIPHLISLLGHEDDRVRAAVRAALRSDRGRTTGPLLAAALDGRDPHLGRLATHVLLTMAEESLAGEPRISIEVFPLLNAARKDPLPGPATCDILATVLRVDARSMRDLAEHIDAGLSLAVLRVRALYAIRRSPEQAGPVVPDLIDCVLTDPECRQHAADTLAVLGPRAVPALVDVLAGSDRVGALWAESILVEAGTRLPAAASAIVAALPGRPEPLRRRLVDVLHASCETGAKALREACASPDDALRPIATQALAEIEARR